MLWDKENLHFKVIEQCYEFDGKNNLLTLCCIIFYMVVIKWDHFVQRNNVLGASHIFMCDLLSNIVRGRFGGWCHTLISCRDMNHLRLKGILGGLCIFMRHFTWLNICGIRLLYSKIIFSTLHFNFET